MLLFAGCDSLYLTCTALHCSAGEAHVGLLLSFLSPAMKTADSSRTISARNLCLIINYLQQLKRLLKQGVVESCGFPLPGLCCLPKAHCRQGKAGLLCLAGLCVRAGVCKAVLLGSLLCTCVQCCAVQHPSPSWLSLIPFIQLFPSLRIPKRFSHICLLSRTTAWRSDTGYELKMPLDKGRTEGLLHFRFCDMSEEPLMSYVSLCSVT